MPIVKYLFKITCKLLLVVADLLLLYVSAVIFIPFIPVNAHHKLSPDDSITVYIRSNGVHTDVVVPVKNNVMDWSTLIHYKDTDSRDSSFSFVGIGWGDKGFYLHTPEWKDLKFNTAFNALFHLSATAIHATFYSCVDTGAQCFPVKLSATEYESLVQYIRTGFRFNTSGNSISIPSKNDGYGSNDAFYEARGAYDLFHTCNTWTNNALKSCNQKACWWTVLDKAIFYQHGK